MVATLQFFLKLQRAHGGHRLKIILQPQGFQTRQANQLVNRKGLVIIFPQPVNHSGHLLTMAAGYTQLLQAMALVTNQQPIENFPLQKRGKHRNVLGLIKQVE